MPLFLRAALSSSPQDSLQVGPPDDVYEQHADLVSRAVLARNPGTMQVRNNIEGIEQVSGSGPGGFPIPPSVRRAIEPMIDFGLGHVRVHHDGLADQSARALNAKAFTHGEHIWLRSDQRPNDLGLMAHEATHVMQQANSAGARHIQRQVLPYAMPAPPGPQDAGLPGGVSTPPATGGPGPASVVAAANEIVQLKGTGRFSPSAPLAEIIDFVSPASLAVNVRFGNLAVGQLYMRRASASVGPPGAGAGSHADSPEGTYETVDDHAYIPLNHPALPGAGALASPKLFITIRQSIVTGSVGFFPWDQLPFIAGPAWQDAFPLERLLGWRGLTGVHPTSFTNQLQDGVLRYSLNDFGFRLEDDFEGTGNFSITDEAQSFSAEVLLHADGVADSTMPLHRSPGAGVFGSQSLSLTLAPTDAFGGTLSGSIRASLANGVMSVTGTGSYRSQRLNGTFTVILAPRATAWAHVIRQLPGGGAPNITAGAALAPGHVVVGWGSLDFRLNEWLTGRASVVIDPEGYITSHGIIRPTRTFEFMTDPERYGAERHLAHADANVTFIPVWGIAEIGGHASADLLAHGRVGPGRVYDLEVEGQFSSRPGSILQARVTGRINLSAQASLEGRIQGGLHFSIIRGGHGKLVRIDLHVHGRATVRAYVELQPEFIREPGGDPSQPQYRINATLTAAGAASLAITGSVSFSLLGIGPRIRVGSFEYPLGSIGMSARISHVIGSGDPIDVDISAADFDESHFTGFVQDLLNNQAPADEHEHETDLAQAGGRPPDRPTMPTEARSSFTMNGVSHSIWLEHTPGPVIIMASNGEGPLTDKLRNEISTVEQQTHGQEGDEATLLTQEAADARGLLGEAVSVEQSLVRLESEERSNPDVAGFQELARGIAAYGAEFSKSDLAQAPAPEAAPQANPDIQIEDGRYIITNRAQLEAVRALGPQRPADLDPTQEDMWGQYVLYFNERLRLLDRDLTPPRRTARREGPSLWGTYTESRSTFDSIRKRKEFQQDLRQTLIGQGADENQVEIDVGLQKGNRRVRYADVVVTDTANNLTIYSAKDRDVRAQVQTLVNRADVTRWIESRLREDIREAVDYYAGTVQVRRPTHPLFRQRVFVSRVILVWNGRSIPPDYRDIIVERGNRLGVEYRTTIRAEVQVVP